MATLCIDFDGTIHDQAHPLPGRRMGEPIEGALEAVRLLQLDHKLIVCTANNLRGHPNHVEKWLEFYNFGNIPVTHEKPVADCYIDDKGYRFSSWAYALADVELLLRGDDGETYAKQS